MESQFRDLAINVWEFLKDALFPVNCLSCQKEGPELCEACSSFVLEKAKRVCPFCHEDETEGRTCQTCVDEIFIDGVTSLGLYHQPFLRKLIQAWKFGSNVKAEKILKEIIIKSRPLFLIPPVDWVVTAIPLHPARFRERGFNQAEVVARQVAQEINSDYCDLLSRREWTDPQAGRASAERRVGDLDGAFTTIDLVPPCVLLCDDVFTSGATMDAAAKVLKEAGAQIVWGFTLARAGR